MGVVLQLRNQSYICFSGVLQKSQRNAVALFLREDDRYHRYRDLFTKLPPSSIEILSSHLIRYHRVTQAFMQIKFAFHAIWKNTPSLPMLGYARVPTLRLAQDFLPLQFFRRVACSASDIKGNQTCPPPLSRLPRRQSAAQEAIMKPTSISLYFPRQQRESLHAGWRCAEVR